MGDMGDVFNSMKRKVKEHRAKMLAVADTTGWTQHTEYHFSRIYNGERIEWWPSGGKAKYKGKMIYGHRKVNALIVRLNKEQP
jgi:hypothetical protein